MPQMYTIFCNDIPIYLTDNIEKVSEDYFFYKDDITIEEVLNIVKSNRFEQVILFHADLKKLWKEFKWFFKIERAAGGLVKNDKGETLFIYRLDKWDLPKGKIEKGESKKKAAKREVKEECGVNKLIINKKLQTTYHIFQRKNRETLKVTYWYSMQTKFNGELIPQVEEDITQVVYKNENEVREALKNTYGNIKLLFN
jgi:ADP-ribose pyrophosphatase YjhB (NUDIX family)